MRAKRKRARGHFPRRRAGWAVHVVFYLILVPVGRVTAARTHVLLQCVVSDHTLATPSFRSYRLASQVKY